LRETHTELKKNLISWILAKSMTISSQEIEYLLSIITAINELCFLFWQYELKKLKDQLEIERQQWIENYMKKQDTHLLAKERELKEGVREARDKEIEMVIARLERETAQGRDESERAAENRIKWVNISN